MTPHRTTASDYARRSTRTDIDERNVEAARLYDAVRVKMNVERVAGARYRRRKRGAAPSRNFWRAGERAYKPSRGYKPPTRSQLTIAHAHKIITLAEDRLFKPRLDDNHMNTMNEATSDEHKTTIDVRRISTMLVVRRIDELREIAGCQDDWIFCKFACDDAASCDRRLPGHGCGESFCALVD